ncbi:MAG: bifunctional pyr operon transcriptional regulator/uracil phosphoribosyltransferase PyrR [Desulfovibrionaceae bacterium]
MKHGKTLLTDKEVSRTLDRLAAEILERHSDCNTLALVGIQRRGVDLAARLKDIIDAKLAFPVPLGKLDINLYRDDWTSLAVRPTLSHTDIPFGIDDTSIVLVDDVLFTGRTVRAALEAILDFGRPTRVELLVLVDRGHRELPIHADYVGKTVMTARKERVDVYVREKDGRDEVCLAE